MAAGIGPIAQGNDIAGSVRFPAYCCGIVGPRVGLGRIPSFNHAAKIARGIGGQLMATQGPLTRTVRGARLALTVMARGDPRAHPLGRRAGNRAATDSAEPRRAHA